MDNFRRHVLVKLPVGTKLERLAAALEGLANSRTRVVVDADPYSMV
jgi:hypothetical protein